MRARQVPQPARHTLSICRSTAAVVVAMVVMATLAVAVTLTLTMAVAVIVIVSAALRLRHACQHARADPLQHVDNDQFAAPA
jgi:hypothetical protein